MPGGAARSGAAVALGCADGLDIFGHWWLPDGEARGTVIINAATGVLARYYHPYARFLAEAGFAVLTYDYRGIGLSRPPRLRGCGYRWRDWGERDFEAAVGVARARDPHGLLAVVGHSIGGFLIGFAPSAVRVDRILTMGAQYAYWRDYAPAHRRRLVLRWHVVMPALTRAFGYFPGRTLGWLQDLPAGVADEWSFRRARMEASYPAGERPGILARFAAVRAPILALSMVDDEYATEPALRRTLAYYGGSERHLVILSPSDLDLARVGHFGLFHSRHAVKFWPLTLRWLGDGEHPWPGGRERVRTSVGPFNSAAHDPI